MSEESSIYGNSERSPLGAASGYTPFERNPRQSGDAAGSSLGSSKAGDCGAAGRALSDCSVCEVCGNTGPWLPLGQFDAVCPQCGGDTPEYQEFLSECASSHGWNELPEAAIDNIIYSSRMNIPGA